MVRTLRATFPILAVAAAACGPAAPDFEVQGARVRVETVAPFAHQADFPARIETTVDAALRYWGGSWDDLRGSTITFGGEYVSCSGHDRALGCFDGDIRVATADPGIGVFDCVEQTVLVHEVGHAVIGDLLHEDPRWMEFDALAAELSGRQGWDESGEAPCEIHPSAWRHLLGRP